MLRSFRVWCAAILIPLCVLLAWRASDKSLSVSAPAAVPASTDNWGLSFPVEGQSPVGNATVEELARYDTWYLGDTSQKVIYLTFDCGYEKYRFIREREDEAAQQEQARQREAEKAERAEKAEKKPARRDGKIERRMNVLERDIAKLEQQLDALDAQMEENASDYVRLGELEEQKNALQAQMDALYEEWEQLDSSLG